MRIWVHPKNKSNAFIEVELTTSDRQCVREQFDTFDEAFAWINQVAKSVHKVIGPIPVSVFDINNGK